MDPREHVGYFVCIVGKYCVILFFGWQVQLTKLIGLNPWTFAYLLFVPLVQASPKVERGDARKGERAPGLMHVSCSAVPKW